MTAQSAVRREHKSRIGGGLQGVRDGEETLHVRSAAQWRSREVGVQDAARSLDGVASLARVAEPRGDSLNSHTPKPEGLSSPRTLSEC